MIDIRDYGAAADGVHDDWTAIMTAAEALPAAGGRLLVPGLAAISQELRFSRRVTVVGESFDGHHDIGPFVPRSGLRWIGAAGGSMLRLAPVTGSSAQALIGCSIEGGFCFDGNGLAAGGLALWSHRYGWFDALHFQGFADGAVCLSLGVAGDLGEAADTQHNVFGRLSFSQYGTRARLIDLGGNGTANTSFNRFGNIAGAHTDGDAIVLSNADNNLFEQVQLVRSAGGIGAGVVFRAGPSEAQSARSNLFMGLSTNAGVRAEGAERGAVPSADNSIWHYDTGNGSPIPQVGSGAGLSWRTDRGVVSGEAISGAHVAESLAGALAARAERHPSNSLYVRNTSGNHVVLSDGVNKWSVRLNGKDLLISQIAGAAGDLMVPSITLTGGQGLRIAGQRVIGPRASGWATPMGYLFRGSWSTQTVTHAQLAQIVAALLADLRDKHGLIGP